MLRLKSFTSSALLVLSFSLLSTVASAQRININDTTRDACFNLVAKQAITGGYFDARGITSKSIDGTTRTIRAAASTETIVGNCILDKIEHTIFITNKINAKVNVIGQRYETRSNVKKLETAYTYSAPKVISGRPDTNRPECLWVHRKITSNGIVATVGGTSDIWNNTNYSTWRC